MRDILSRLSVASQQGASIGRSIEHGSMFAES